MISIDPSRRKSGGALLGDRIRMNAIDRGAHGPRVFMRCLATRDSGSEISAALPDVLAAVQGRRLRPRDRRDLGHRPGRRRDRAAGRRADVRDDARVRRREPAREDRHARLRRVRRDQQVRPQGRRRCAARRRQAGAAQPPGVRQAARRDAGVRHDGEPLQRRRRDRAVPGAAAAPGRARPGARAEGTAAAASPRATARTRCRSCPARACATWPRSPTRCAATRTRARSRPRLAREIQQLRESARMLARRKPDKRATRPKRSIDLAAQREAQLDADAKKLLAMWPQMQQGLRRRRVRREDPRQGDPHRADAHDACPAARSARSRCRSTKTTARS